MNAPLATDLHMKAAELDDINTKAVLIELARSFGWKGDPERAYTDITTGEYINQTEKDRIERLRNDGILATGKLALSYFCAAQQTPASQIPKIQEPLYASLPVADPVKMTVKESAEIQNRLDKLLDMGGAYPILTGNYIDDHKTLEAAIKSANAYKASQITKREPATIVATENSKAHALMKELMAELSQSQTNTASVTMEQVKQVVIGELLTHEKGMDSKLMNIAGGIAQGLTDNFIGVLDNLKADLLEKIAQNTTVATPKEIVITTPSASTTVNGVLHPKFEKILRLVNAGVHVLLVGGAGSGKTHLAQQIAKALHVDYGVLNGSAGASEAQLTGWLLPTGAGGQFEYKASPFVTLFGKGNSLFCFDELDAFDPNMLMTANSALSNGFINIPQNFAQNIIQKGERAFIMATANTFGTGADMIYSARTQLDGATLDRFYLIFIDYMTEFEANIMGADFKKPKTWEAASADETDIRADLKELHKWLEDLREKVTTARLRRIVSTRAYQKADAARRALVPIDEIKKDLVQGWTVDELKKVGIGA